MRRLAAAPWVMLAVGACAGQPAAPVSHGGAAPSGVPADMPSTIERVMDDEGSITSFFNIDWSESRLDRLEAFHRESLAGLDAIDFDSLDQDGKVDYLLLRGALRSRLADGVLARRRLAEMDPLLPHRRTVIELEEARWRMEKVDAASAAERLSAIPEAIKAVRARIEKARADPNAGADSLAVSPVLAQRAASACDEIRRSLRAWYDYSDGFVPEFSWWARRPYESADRAMDEYAGFLRRDIAGIKGEPDDPLIGDPIGREALLADLRAEMIPYSPEELLAIGEREFAWCEARLLEASREMGLGDDWRAALERVKQDHVPPGEQADLVATQGREVIQFLKDRDLVTIPPLCEELWRLGMHTPAEQRIWPFAVYNHQRMMVGYPTDAMEHADKLMSMRGNNRHFTRIVTPHELIPGHHLQLYMAERHREYRGAFSTPFFVEGWALYWEMKLWDLGYPRTPEERIGMLFWRMHRCARIVVSLKFHLGQMTPPEMIDFLVDRVGLERSGATGEVRRYIGGMYSPLYQCAYMIGGLQLRAIHDEAMSRGWAERDFNDAVLRQGSIPMELVRASVLELPLTRDHETSWRFGEPAP